MVFAGGQRPALCFWEFFVLFLDFLYFMIVVVFDLLKAISDDHYKGISGVHLVKGVHHSRESITP